MKIGRNMILAVLLTFCVTASLVMVIPIKSDTSKSYDPWSDIDDNGVIGLSDLVTLANHYGANGIATGEYINKTLLLIQVNATYGSLVSRIDNLNSSLLALQSQVNGMNATNLMPLIDSLNSSLIQLQSGVNALNTTVIQLQTSDGNLNASFTQLQTTVNTLNNTLSLQINTLQGQIAAFNTIIVAMNTTITQLQNSNATLSNRVTNLEGSLSSLLDRVSALEGNFSVTNLKLAPYAIPFNMTYSNTHSSTTQTSYFNDMPYTSVMLTLNRTSQLLIMFSADAGISFTSGGDEKVAILCNATVNGMPVTPNGIQLTPLIGITNSHSHRVAEGAFAFNFYFGPVSAGTYTINIQWMLSASGTGDVWSRTLEVIGLPA